MKFHYHIDDDGYAEFLQKIIDMDHIEGSALGITKKVINKGEDSLSSKQYFVFKKEVLDEYVISECFLCKNDIPWSEMYDAATDHAMCNYCWHMIEKDD